MKNKLQNLKRSLGAAAALGVLATQQAYAAVPAGATDALNTAGTDVGTIGWAVFGVLVAAAAFKYMRRAL
ncbi:major capsid protein [Pseudomonas sp. SL4(2022)]|uniref:major capsid protein n=1 Tax=Pseudomonas sp. SL4(2022) TaxID=2994661 RepID=UPI0022701292|nr:major capsid protein [Pseudomonas sp. SL4(2022)]WAC43975.1 major capsid protein [Pseudomonas sp. SL4(2022)]